MNLRLCTRVCLTGLLSLYAVWGQTADVDRGKKLYEANCTRCHSEEVFLRNDRMVNSKEQLVERIRQCELSNDLTWFQEEVDDVAAYLDREFYQFDLK